ncbi:MAG: DNA polymerase III subunit gamma/tau [Candidatus Omnitrophota bacterium]
MSYQILAQKYRPQTFEDVIGQEAVTRTLKNSILQGRIANAYIFCGPRGVGKTSIARLLSKILNCEKPMDKRPCNECSSCKEISQSNNIDVLEIDGASNRGIDEIRTLRENVKFSPSKGAYKIYIIDEVHMLTQEAFNALLKTLEEPPAHVKFIFATTEPHKVLPTIMSRCQRFDFKRISPKMMFDRIIGIAKKEKIDVDEKAALLIARSADGSMRDALVILDQMVSFSAGKILADDVIELLGMVHKDKMFELSDAVINSEPDRVISILDELVNNGKDPVFITNSLIAHYRDLMILKTTKEPTSDMAFSKDELEKLNAQLDKLSIEEILYILQNLSHCLTLMKGAFFARAPLEIALVRLTKRGNAIALTDILEKIDNMGTWSAPEKNFSSTSSSESVNAPVKPVRPKAASDNPQIQETAEEINNNGMSEENEMSPEFNWKALLNYVRSKKMSVFTFLSAAKPVEFNKKKVVIGFGKDHAFNKEALETESNKNIIEEAANKVLGASPRLEFTLLEFLDETAEQDAAKTERAAAIEKEVMGPVVEQAMDVFGGHVVRDLKEEPGR